LTGTLQFDLTFEAPAADPVSVNAAEQGAVMARRATAYVAAWRDQIAQTVVNLETQLVLYQGAEAENRGRFA
ncbi:MAG: PE domain-containing protein, partial [Pseudonocardia sp.]|nr:PE domain-containing protein [Pseudonocardia sp.]